MSHLGSRPELFDIRLAIDKKAPIGVFPALSPIPKVVMCGLVAPAAIAATGKTDPREVVADELAGQAVTFLAIPFFIPVILTTGQLCIITSGGFLLFRLFDIVKPWPIRKLEKLPKGWGILADDLMAGVFAAIVLLIVIFLWMGG